VGLDQVIGDQRQVAIIRQSMLKAAVDSLDKNSSVEDIIERGKEFFHFVLHGEKMIEIPDVDLKKYMKEDK
jgi:hypothetical protein